MTKVLVTGATGKVGAHTVRELIQRGASVRAFARDPEKAATRLGDGVEVAVGDLDDPVSVRLAMRGADRVVLISANGPNEAAHEIGVIDASAAAWVERIVKLSAVGANSGSALLFSDAHGRGEEHLRQAAVPSVVLQANFLMSTLLASAETIRAAGQIFASAADAKIAMVDPRDVAGCLAAAVMAEGDDSHTYVVSGPQAITYADVAEVLSGVLGRPVRYVDVPDEVLRGAMLDSGAPEWLADGVSGVYGQIRAGLTAQTTDSVLRLTGQNPRSFAEFARDHRSAFEP